MSHERDGGTRKKEESQTATDGEKTAVFDCAIVGGGPAGLSAALYLGRMRRKVIIIDDRKGRSTWHQVNRNYLGFPDGVHATALRELGDEQAKRYGADFLDARATGVSYEGEDAARVFTVSTTEGPVQARTLILATGVSDHFPEFDGSEECIGKSMFWCIICDGFEAIDKRVVVLGNDDHAAALALQLLVFTEDVILVTGGKESELTPERIAALKEHGITYYEKSCEVYTCSELGSLASIRLDNGSTLELDLLFVSQRTEPNTHLAKELNIMVSHTGYIRADTEQCTNVAGVYAAGDVTRLHSHQVTSAVHEGGMAASAVNYYLYEDWQKD